MALDAETAAGGLIRKVQKALGKGSPAAAARSAALCPRRARRARRPAGRLACRQCPRGAGVHRRQAARAGTRSASAACRPAARARCRRARSSRSSTTTCRSWSIRCWASCRPAASPCASCSTRSSRPSATRPGTCRPSPAPATRTGATATRKATSPSTCAPCRRPTARDLAAALSDILGEVRVVVADWRPMLQRLAAATPAAGAGAGQPCAAGCWREAIAFLAVAGAGQLHLPRARASSSCTGDAETGDLAPVDGSGLGVLRDPEVQVLRRGSELVAMTPEVRRFFFAPAPLIITKANVVSRVHRRAHMDYIGIKTYHADGKPKGEIRFVGLFTSQAYVSSPSQIPLAAPQGRDGARGAPAIRRPATPARRCSTSWTRSRATSCSRSAPRSCRHGARASSTSRRGRACACSRASTASTASCPLLRLRAARPLQHRACASASARCWPRPTRAASPRSIPTSPKARWCACSSSSAAIDGPTPQADVAELERGIVEIVRTWEDRLADAIAALRASAPTPCWPSTGPPSPPATRRPSRPSARWRTSSASSAWARSSPSSIDFYRVPGMPASRIHAAVYSLGRADPALGARAGAGEPGLLGHRRALLSHHARASPTASATSRCTTWCWRPPTAPPSSSSVHDKRLEGCFLAVLRAARPTTTASIG